MNSFTIFLTILSLIAYAGIGFSRSTRAMDEKQYFVAGQTVSANDYANLSVGYALQMAALFLFAYWGFVYGVGALWTAFFWFIGYALLYFILPQFNKYRAEATHYTLHSFIRQQFSSSKRLQVIAALATIVGLLGAMFAEVDYTVAVYHPALSVDPFILQAGFLSLGLTYIIWNGYKAEVNAERVQVPIAYIGLLVVILFCLPRVYMHSGARAFWFIVAGTGVSLTAMICAKLIDVASGSAIRFKWLDWQAAIPICALFVLLCGSTWVHFNQTPGSSSNVLERPLSAQLLAQGSIGLLSLFIANVLWMPVDVSTWQRVGSVAGDEHEGLRELRRGTFRVTLESPASWCLGAVLGWIISAGGYVPVSYEEPYLVVAAFANELYEGAISEQLGSWQRILYPIFVVSCLAVMLSTVTSILSAVSLTADRDLLPDDNGDNMVKVRIVSLILLVFAFLMYEALRYIFSASLPTLLYGAYSAQLSLIIATIFALYKRRLNGDAAFASIVTGLVFALIATVVAIFRPDQNQLAVLPPLFAVGGALIGYVVVYEINEAANDKADAR